jgi:hypothetical protein
MRMMRFAGLATMITLLSGCYTLQPARQGYTPQIGDEMAFDITDAGRVALGGAIGPEIGQVEGKLLSRENAEYLVGVTAVRFLRGGEQVWKGEQVRLKPEYVGYMYERHFSKGRTIALSAAGVAGFAFVVTRGLVGSSRSDPIEPPPGGTALRVP